jgi:hypothetical protein
MITTTTQKLSTGTEVTTLAVMIEGELRDITTSHWPAKGSIPDSTKYATHVGDKIVVSDSLHDLLVILETYTTHGV